MSHIVIGTVEVKDLRAVKAGCKRLGVEFREGQKTHVCYSGVGRCDHALHAPGVNYEVGLVKSKSGYKLAYDPYGDGAYGRHDGKKLEAVVGKNCGKLLQHYGIELVKQQLKSKGLLVSEHKVDNDIKVTIGGYA